MSRSVFAWWCEADNGFPDYSSNGPLAYTAYLFSLFVLPFSLSEAEISVRFSSACSYSTIRDPAGPNHRHVQMEPRDVTSPRSEFLFSCFEYAVSRLLKACT